MIVEPVGALQGVFSSQETIHRTHRWRQGNVIVANMVIVVVLLWALGIAVDQILVGGLLTGMFQGLGRGGRAFVSCRVRYYRRRTFDGSF